MLGIGCKSCGRPAGSGIEVQSNITAAETLPGMARADEAARFLVHRLLEIAGEGIGLHVFVTHDSLVTVTAARLLGETLGLDDWPGFLEGAFSGEVPKESKWPIGSTWRFWRDQRKESASQIAPLQIVSL
jgi:hypothetical protein